MKKKKMLSKRKRRDTCKTDFKIVFNQSSSSNKNLTNLKKLSHNSEEKQSRKCSRIATVIPPLEQGLLGPPRLCWVFYKHDVAYVLLVLERICILLWLDGVFYVLIGSCYVLMFWDPCKIFYICLCCSVDCWEESIGVSS